MFPSEKIFSLSYKGFSLKVSSFMQERTSEYVLFLHVIQSNKALFVPLMEQSFLDRYSLLSIDCIGFGNSSKPEDFSYDVQDQANIIEELIKQSGITKLHIIGHSLGGVIGTLLLQPLKVHILSFINFEGNLTLTDSGLSKTVAGYSFDDFRSGKYEQIKKDLQQSHEPSASFRSDWLESIPDYAFYKTSVSLVAYAKSGKLLQLFTQSSCKKIYMIGDKNIFKKDILPKNIPTILIPHAGHFMLLDNPHACFSAIEAFLNKTT